MARSLLDDPRFESIGRGKGGSRGGGGGANSDKIKLAIAIVLFLIAGGVIAWYYELLPGTGRSRAGAPVMTREEKQQFEEQVKKSEEEAMKRPDVQRGSD